MQRQRTIVVTGAASGIGAATVDHLLRSGHRVVGVDLADAEVIADLATSDGRAAMLAGVGAATPGGIDGIVANAGVYRTDSLCLRVNYFGAIATLEGLRPMLVAPAPRAVVVSSRALLQPVDEDVIAACLADDEVGAVGLADERASGEMFYASSKRAVARWLRRAAVRPEWAGAGIALNAVAPGSVDTPLIVSNRSPEERERVLRERPMPLGGVASATDIAAAIAFFLSPENTRTTGQVLFVDGGGEAVMRGDDVWRTVTPPGVG